MTSIPAIQTKFSSAAPAEANEAQGLDPAAYSQLRQYAMMKDSYEQRVLEKEGAIKTAENISSSIGVGTMGAAMGLAGAYAMGAVNSWLLGGLLPAALILIPMANRLVKGSEKVGKFLD